MGNPYISLTPQPGSGSLVQSASFDTSNNGVKMDPRILEVLQQAAQAFPLKVEAFSGVQDRSSGTTNHPGGYAIDVRIYDENGKPLANSPADAKRQGQDLGAAYRTYEAFAQTARDVQQRTYPELGNTFRWGGYFIAGDTPFDLMHFDINPKMGGATGGGDWENGLSAEGRKLLKGADSVGMNAVVNRQLADLGFKGPNAVADYQRAKGLNPDGLIGPATTKRLALDVAPPQDVPNPYGLKDTFDAIKRGDPKALEDALYGTMSQVMSAHNAGMKDDAIAAQFNQYLDHLSPAEQANMRANFNASPDMQGAVPKEANRFGFLASGPLQGAVNAAMQRSQDLADSLITNTLVGKTTQADVNLAMQNMAKVNPGQSYGDLAARAIQGNALGQKLTPGVGQPPPMPVTGAPPVAAKPPGQPFDPKALLTALQTLIPGLPGLGAGAVGMPGAPPGPPTPTYSARPPMAAAPGSPGVMTALTPRVRPDTNESYSGAPGMQVNRPGNIPPNPTLRPGEGGTGLQPGAPAPTDNLDMRTRPDGNGGVVATKPYETPAANAAGLASLLGRGPGGPTTSPGVNSYAASPGDVALQKALDASLPQRGWEPQRLVPLQQMANQIDAGAGTTGSRNVGNDGGGSTSPSSPNWVPPTVQPLEPYTAAPPTSAADKLAMTGPVYGTRTADTGLDASQRQYWTPPPEVDPNDYDPLANGSVYNTMLPREQPTRTVAAAQPIQLTPRAQPQEDRVAETPREMQDYGSYGDGNGGLIFIPMQLGY